MVRVFVSFDYDTDRDLYDSLVGQIRRGDPSIAITDQSLRTAVHDDAWKREARKRIRRVDAVIFICGVNTHSAKGVEAEMSITREQRKPYLLLTGRRGATCSKPRNARSTDILQPWEWRKIESFLRR